MRHDDCAAVVNRKNNITRIHDKSVALYPALKKSSQAPACDLTRLAAWLGIIMASATSVNGHIGTGAQKK